MNHILWNDVSVTENIEEYFYNLIPQLVWDRYDFKNQKAYIAVHLDYLCDKPITLAETHWYEKNSENLNAVQIFENQYIKIYEIIVKAKMNTIDITCIVKDHPENQIIKDYVNSVQDRLRDKIIYGMFTFCDSGTKIRIHKDGSDYQKNRLHLVLKNGDISSIVLYDDHIKEIDRINGSRGDVFWFDAGNRLHSVERPKSNRLHFIMSTQNELAVV